MVAPAGHSSKRRRPAPQWPVSWSEPACLSQAGSTGFREIVVEGTFADVARVFARYRMDAWADLRIAFPDRRSAPLYFHEQDFLHQVVGRLLSM